MYKTWVSSGPDAEALARALEVHLNEFAEDVISVAYAVHHEHHVLAVYRAIDLTLGAAEESAVTVAEDILEQVQQ
jgi:hypothetical protein